MEKEKRKPAAGGTARGLRNCSLLVSGSGSNNNNRLPEIQSDFLSRRFGLNPSHSAVLAPLAFANGGER